MTARLIFMGTPEFAVPALKGLTGRHDVEVGLVVTQPDRPSGRGRKPRATPVALAAERLGLDVYRVGSLRTGAERQPIVDGAPDLIVVAAFGLILGASVLSLPRRGCLNLHASILPAYRGANPIAMAIRDGRTETGVSLMRMDAGLDTGPVYGHEAIVINANDTTGSLTARLAEVAARLLDRKLDAILSGRLAPVPQGAGATCTRPMIKNDGWIEWSAPAALVERHVRAMSPWPRGWTTLPSGERLQVHRCQVVADEVPLATIAARDGTLVVGCGDRAVMLETVQLPGGTPVAGDTLLSRGVVAPGSVLGSGGAPPEAPPVVSPC